MRFDMHVSGFGQFVADLLVNFFEGNTLGVSTSLVLGRRVLGRSVVSRRGVGRLGFAHTVHNQGGDLHAHAIRWFIESEVVQGGVSIDVCKLLSGRREDDAHAVWLLVLHRRGSFVGDSHLVES